MFLFVSQNTFPNLYKTLQLDSSDLWMPFQRSSQCEQDIPPAVAKKISLFQQVRTLAKRLKITLLFDLFLCMFGDDMTARQKPGFCSCE